MELHGEQGKGQHSHPEAPLELHPTEGTSANNPWAAKARGGGGRCRNVNENSNKKDSLNYVIIKL